MNNLDSFLHNEQKRRADNDFFNKFDKNEYKVNDALDEFTRMNTQNRFDKQLEIENAIKRAHDAVSEAIKLINESKTPVLKKVEIENIKDRSHLLEYYIPENEELYEFLDRYNHKFTSKHDDFLIINIPHDFDKAVEMLKHYEKYVDDVKEYKHSDGTPIYTYYFNKIASLNDIFDALNKVFDNEHKPFKIHFQLSGVFESKKINNYNEDENKYEYEARDIKWRHYRQSIPIIITSNQDIERENVHRIKFAAIRNIIIKY